MVCRGQGRCWEINAPHHLNEVLAACVCLDTRVNLFQKRVVAQQERAIPARSLNKPTGITNARPPVHKRAKGRKCSVVGRGERLKAKTPGGVMSCLSMQFNSDLLLNENLYFKPNIRYSLIGSVPEPHWWPAGFSL